MGGSEDGGTAPRLSRGGTSSVGGAGESTGERASARGGGRPPPGPGGRPLLPGGPRWTTAVALAALAALAAWLGLAAAGRFPWPGWLYHLCWYTTLLGADAWLGRREGRLPLLGKPRLALSLWLWSVPVWLLFELLNLRVANWYYVLASDDLLVRRLSAALAFATVLPAIYLGHRAGESVGLFEGAGGRRLRVGPRLPRALFLAGLLFVALALWRPTLFYPLIWGSVTLLVEPWNWRRAPERSLLGDLERGRWARLLRLLAAGLAAGVLWETFNAFAATRWIYTVPGLEDGKLFEMPVPGYLGFPVFALDCFVLYQALVSVGVAAPGWDGGAPGRTGAARRVPVWIAAALYSLAVLAAVDRYTVDSFEPRLTDLPGVDAATAGRRGRAGYGLRELAEADLGRVPGLAGIPEEQAERLRGAARLALLRGMGTRNAAALLAAGIADPCDLAAASAERVSRAVRRAREDPGAGRAARVRVWIRAAAERCGEGANQPGAGDRAGS